METHLYRDKPMGVHVLHNWWYRCLQRARIVPKGTTSGERIHKARHTAGQRLLDTTGNLKAVQKLLGHESIQTTGDIYTDWDVEHLAESLLAAVQDDENGIVPQRASGTRIVERKVEAAGIEPASAAAPVRASTSVVRA
jgi:hypothetical protein